MRLPALIHLVESVHALSRCDRIRVRGFSALLASFPEPGEPGQPLEVSYDADLLIEPSDERLAAMLHEAIGDGSLFASRTGYHADILRPTILETLPAGWQERAVRLEVGVEASALSPPDVTAVKLRLGREKDLELCRHLIAVRLVDGAVIRKSLEALPLSEAEVVQAFRRLREVSGETPA